MRKRAPKVTAILFWFIILVSCWNCGSAQETAPYQIFKTEQFSSGERVSIYLKDRLEKEQVIAIAAKEKKKRKLDKLVFYFYLENSENRFLNRPWAVTSYPPECSSCPAETDMAGNKLELKMLGVSRAEAEELKKLTLKSVPGLNLDSIPDKKLIGSVIDDDWHSKNSFYFFGKENAKILLVQLFKNRYQFEIYTRVPDDQDGLYLGRSGEEYISYQKDLNEISILEETGTVLGKYKLADF